MEWLHGQHVVKMDVFSMMLWTYEFLCGNEIRRRKDAASCLSHGTETTQSMTIYFRRAGGINSRRQPIRGIGHQTPCSEPIQLSGT